MSKYINEEPLKEMVCSDCGKMLRQRRVGHGLKIWRVYVHKDTRMSACGTKEEQDKKYLEELERNPFPKFYNHKPTCTCPDCERERKWSGR